MIAHISGEIVEVTEQGIVVDVGGVGYQLYTPSGTTAIGTTQTFFTVEINREDTHDLYGFVTREEKELFTMLISVSGVGPKSALGILSLYPPATILSFIAKNDPKSLSLAPGIGKKSAEKIILELRDKLPKLSGSAGPTQTDIVEALMSLGYRDIQIRTVISAIDATLPLETQIRTALQLLQK